LQVWQVLQRRWPARCGDATNWRATCDRTDCGSARANAGTDPDPARRKL